MEKLSNQKLLPLAWYSKDKGKSLRAFNLLIKRFKDQQNGCEKVGLQKKVITTKDLLDSLKYKSQESVSLLFLEVLEKEGLLTVENCLYLMNHLSDEKVIIRAFEMCVNVPDLTIDKVCMLCKGVPTHQRKLKGVAQEYLVMRKDVTLDDLRYVAEYGTTKGVAIKALSILLVHPECNKLLLGRIYRTSNHMSVRTMVRHFVK